MREPKKIIMSLKKQFLKSKPICKVTFSLTNEEALEGSKVELLGDFNEWNSKKAIELKKFKNGTFKTTINLPTEKEYQFKYLIDGDKWENDWNADKYVSNGLNGEENSVVTL